MGYPWIFFYKIILF